MNSLIVSFFTKLMWVWTVTPYDRARPVSSRFDCSRNDILLSRRTKPVLLEILSKEDPVLQDLDLSSTDAGWAIEDGTNVRRFSDKNLKLWSERTERSPETNSFSFLKALDALVLFIRFENVRRARQSQA